MHSFVGWTDVRPLSESDRDKIAGILLVLILLLVLLCVGPAPAAVGVAANGKAALKILARKLPQVAKQYEGGSKAAVRALAKRQAVPRALARQGAGRDAIQDAMQNLEDFMRGGKLATEGAPGVGSRRAPGRQVQRLDDVPYFSEVKDDSGLDKAIANASEAPSRRAGSQHPAVKSASGLGSTMHADYPGRLPE